MGDKSRNSETIVITNPSPELQEFLKKCQETKSLHLKEMRLKFDHVMPVEGLDEIKVVECALKHWWAEGWNDSSSTQTIERLVKRAEKYRKKLENK